MYFRKCVPEEHRCRLKSELKSYVKTHSLTSDERKELEKWVGAGNSPYDGTGFVYGENGWPLPFIEERRLINQAIRETAGMSPEEAAQYLLENF